MQMQQMRVGHASQVPVPPASAAPLEISREMRQQLRVTRHRAFERLQENAQWTKELLEGSTIQDNVTVTSTGSAMTAEELRNRVEAQKEAVQAAEMQLLQQKEAQETTQRQFEEILTALKSASDATAMKECEARLASEKVLLIPGKPRKMEIVRL